MGGVAFALGVVMMKLLDVVGARPNFQKLAPVHRAGDTAALSQFVGHTGQHYDDALTEGWDGPAGERVIAALVSHC